MQSNIDNRDSPSLRAPLSATVGLRNVLLEMQCINDNRGGLSLHARTSCCRSGCTRARAQAYCAGMHATASAPARPARYRLWRLRPPLPAGWCESASGIPPARSLGCPSPLPPTRNSRPGPPVQTHRIPAPTKRVSKTALCVGSCRSRHIIVDRHQQGHSSEKLVVHPVWQSGEHVREARRVELETWLPRRMTSETMGHATLKFSMSYRHEAFQLKEGSALTVCQPNCSMSAGATRRPSSEPTCRPPNM